MGYYHYFDKKTYFKTVESGNTPRMIGFDFLV